MVDDFSENELPIELKAQLRSVEPADDATKEQAISAAMGAFDENAEKKKVSWLYRPSTMQTVFGAAAVLLLFTVTFQVLRGTSNDSSTSPTTTGNVLSFDNGNAGTPSADKSTAGQSPSAAAESSTSLYHDAGVISSNDAVKTVLDNKQNRVSLATASSSTPCLQNNISARGLKDIVAAITFQWKPKNAYIDAYGFKVASNPPRYLVISQSTCQTIVSFR